MSIAGKIKKHGASGSARIAIRMIAGRLANAYEKWAVRKAPKYCAPTALEMTQIEMALRKEGIEISDFAPVAQDLTAFHAANYFPLDYHGGINGPVWDEKLLEHWIAFEHLGLAGFQPEDVYVDVAAGESPWAKSLREHLGITAFAIDLKVTPTYKELPFYRAENATATKFADASVRGVSLQCAYEMFMRDDDINLLKELARILQPGGKAVIVPLYMHTHYCAYSSPAYYGKGNSDALAQEYVCSQWNGIPSARFYDANALKQRVLDRIEQFGMHYKLLALRNKDELGKGIYCHFILEITK